ncbi:hypothetical protein [Flavisphingopyxis soli]|nr:hypothetical protein [Sphingorhabdus soli]
MLAFSPSAVIAQLIAGEEVIEPSAKQMQQLQALTPEGARHALTISDDELETVVNITSEKVWKSRGKFTDKVRSDNFLRAFIDKSSGAVRYQLYQEITYSGEWRRITTVNYATPNGPVSAPVVSIAKDVITCDYGLCVYREAVGFDIPAKQLEAIAASYAPGQSRLWRFRFKGQSGLDWEDRLAPAEAAGVLLAVRAYRAEQGN